MKKLINYLLQGLLYIAPLGITAYIIYGAFTLVDGLSQKLLAKFFDVQIPGLGLLSLLIFLIFVGDKNTFFCGICDCFDPTMYQFRCKPYFISVIW